jgi:hypothetical protein
MKSPTVKSVSLTLGAFIVVSFAVQASSHFVLNVEHYAGISIMRKEPIMQLGILAMVVQGTLAGLLFPAVRWTDGGVRSGLTFAWLLGAFLGSYIVLAEPAKYAVPSVTDWMLVESAASFVQFSLFGVLLALIHRNKSL